MSTLVATTHLQDIETDGVCINQTRDPPGQRSVYIPPGDTERESYRLSTFKDFPQNVPINPCQFAVNGFYYTGYKDRVKCFSCGQSCENWLAGDDISSAVWHKRDCEFKNGTDITNIPFGALFQHRNVIHNTSHTSTQLLPSHATQNEQTPMAGTRTNQQLASRHNNHTTNSEDQRSNLTELFPCLNPINPHMRRTEARLQTFIDNSRLWPSYRLRATPEEIADAGMYFLGERDRVKCWYCNGGLQNWERDDDPWVEHAKWFPMCEYLLQRKGPDFVHRIVAQYPDLSRPTLRNPALVSANQIVRVVQSGPRKILGAFTQANRAPVFVDAREELRKRNRKIEQFLTSSEVVSEAKLLGSEDDVIRAAVKRSDIFVEYKCRAKRRIQNVEDPEESLVVSISTPSHHLVPFKLEDVLPFWQHNMFPKINRVEVKLGNLKIDTKTLREMQHQWFDDLMMDATFQLLTSHQSSTQLETFASVSAIEASEVMYKGLVMPRNMLQVSCLLQRSCLAPINVCNSHWILLAKSNAKQELYIYDPLGNESQHQKILQRNWRSLLDMSMCSSVEPLQHFHFRTRKHKLQQDGISCGPLVIKEAQRYISEVNFAIPTDASSCLQYRREIINAWLHVTDTTSLLNVCLICHRTTPPQRRLDEESQWVSCKGCSRRSHLKCIPSHLMNTNGHVCVGCSNDDYRVSASIQIMRRKQ